MNDQTGGYHTLINRAVSVLDAEKGLSTFDTISYVQGLKDAVAILTGVADHFKAAPTKTIDTTTFGKLLTQVAAQIAIHPMVDTANQMIDEAVDKIDGLESDLDSVLDVLVDRINGTRPLHTAADWVRLNYPARANRLRPVPPGDFWMEIDTVPPNTWVELFSDRIRVGRLRQFSNDASRRDLWVETSTDETFFIGNFTHWRSIQKCAGCDYLRGSL